MKTVFPNLSLFIAFIMLISACDKEDDNDSVVQPIVTADDLTVPEGDDTYILSLRLMMDKATQTNVIIRYSTKDGTAIAGKDYVAQTDETLTIPAGVTEASIDLTILGNTFLEPDKYFEIVMVNALNATLERNTIRITLLNDDEDEPGGLIIPDIGYVSPESYQGYQLVWSDEFQTETLNPAYWTHEIGTGNNGWGNNELQYYKADNTTIHQNEYLVIEAREEIFGGSQYTSSRIITSNKASFKYGRVDIRAALPKTQGIWPALWMLGESFWQQGWPSCGEIDIMEMLGHQPNKVYGTAHWGPNFSQRQLKGSSIFSQNGVDFNNSFHVFSIIWEEDRIEWLVDDRSFNTLTPNDMNGFEYPFNEEFFFIFNIAVGGQWPGYPDQSTVLPQYMIVDYIRVFQKE